MKRYSIILEKFVDFPSPEDATKSVVDKAGRNLDRAFIQIISRYTERFKRLNLQKREL